MDFAAIGAFFRSIAEALHFVNAVQDAKNTPEMRANKTADIRSQDADRINTDIAAANKGDAKAQEAIRRDLGED